MAIGRFQSLGRGYCHCEEHALSLPNGFDDVAIVSNMDHVVVAADIVPAEL
ncbi:MAG: hypothetical protein J4N80_06415 [Chloroflexi bacterium]|nr:hypothetical protein [Chloroflexota bacterium]